jgi:hypothetical protein
MLVILKTRCGCSKQFETTMYPPHEWYIVPLMRTLPVKPLPDLSTVFDPLPADVRKFQRKDFDNQGPRFSTVVYEEVE